MMDRNEQSLEERITSYLLGDLPEDQAAEVEALMARDESCRALAEELRPTLQLLGDALAADNSAPAALEPERKAVIRAALPRPMIIFPLNWAFAARAAAVLAICLLGAFLILPALTPARRQTLSSAKDAGDRAGQRAGTQAFRNLATIPADSAPEPSAEAVFDEVSEDEVIGISGGVVDGHARDYDRRADRKNKAAAKELEKVPLGLELPKPGFAGTPVDTGLRVDRDANAPIGSGRAANPEEDQWDLSYGTLTEEVPSSAARYDIAAVEAARPPDADVSGLFGGRRASGAAEVGRGPDLQDARVAKVGVAAAEGKKRDKGKRADLSLTAEASIQGYDGDQDSDALSDASFLSGQRAEGRGPARRRENRAVPPAIELAKSEDTVLPSSLGRSRVSTEAGPSLREERQEITVSGTWLAGDSDGYWSDSRAGGAEVGGTLERDRVVSRNAAGYVGGNIGGGLGEDRPALDNTYGVQPGDTLLAIAEREDTTVPELAELNGIADPDKITAGTPLRIHADAKPANELYARVGDDDGDQFRFYRLQSKRAKKAEASVVDEVGQEPYIDREADVQQWTQAPSPAEHNPFVETTRRPFSTFAMDVDTASYTLARNYIYRGVRPPPELVRTEEFVNFFDYDYPAPTREVFSVNSRFSPAPFGEGYLLRIGVKARALGRQEQKQAVLTLVVDTSGSMDTPDRLGLLQKSLGMLLDQLDPRDKVALVQYGSAAHLLLEHTPVAEKDKILDAVRRLQSAGSTHLEEGLHLGYQMAARAFVGGAANRVLLLSDGVANLGSDSADDILARVGSYRQQGIFLSVFGFGAGTYNDAMLETLANRGDGSYQFIDSAEEAQRVLVDEWAATLNVVARDAKIQVEFNPARVQRYRQLGYENRQLRKEAFRNDAVDAGEVGSGQSVTALYEMVLHGDDAVPVATVRIRYRDTATGLVREVEKQITSADLVPDFARTDARFKLAAAAAEFAEILRLSPFAAGSGCEDVAEMLRPVALELSLDQRVQELLRLVQTVAAGK